MRHASPMMIVSALLLAGCSAAGDRPERALVAPGKYVLYDCAQLAHAEARFVERDKELTRLTARAKEGPAGGLISTMVYDPDLYSNRGELADVRREQAAKNCQPAQRAGPPAR
jgi:hypothetical protein